MYFLSAYVKFSWENLVFHVCVCIVHMCDVYVSCSTLQPAWLVFMHFVLLSVCYCISYCAENQCSKNSLKSAMKMHRNCICFYSEIIGMHLVWSSRSRGTSLSWLTVLQLSSAWSYHSWLQSTAHTLRDVSTMRNAWPHTDGRASFALFLPRDTTLAWYMLSSCHRLFITSQHCTKMAKRKITQTMPYDSPGTVVFWCQKSRRNSNVFTPTGAPNGGGVGSNGDFRPTSGYISETVQDLMEH